MKLLTIFVAVCSAIALVEGTSPILEPVEPVEFLPMPVEPVEVLPMPVCDIMCTMQYDPVCCLPLDGCGDYITNGNSCLLDVYNCQNPGNQYYVYAKGECESIGKAISIL